MEGEEGRKEEENVGEKPRERNKRKRGLASLIRKERRGGRLGYTRESQGAYHMFPSDPTGALGCTDGSIRWRRAG